MIGCEINDDDIAGFIASLLVHIYSANKKYWRTDEIQMFLTHFYKS